MNDIVRIEDYLRFCEAMVVYHTEVLRQLESSYEAEESKFESNFFNKLFNLKYKNCRKGRKSWKGGWSAIYWKRSSISEWTRELNRASYLSKIDHFYFELTPAYSESFYKWCAENNIPY